ncbi:class I SAM-dependent methyltransferase [bacterium]|nr:MAG: class I SAM-dependent methyltransferase [bacterium]
MIEGCPICQSIDIEVKGNYRGVHTTFAGLHRTHCHSCGMVFTTPIPGETALEKYNASYFTSAHGGKPQNKITTAFFSGLARLRVAYIEHYLDMQKIKVSSLLELGPGPGFFASNWLIRHPQTNYLAIETDRSCHDSLQKLGVLLIDTITNEKEIAPVDLVVMSHVLEHVSNPIKFLSDVTRNLRRGGALFIEVPCRDWEHKHIDEPHLLFFDKKPMLYLLKKLGFENIQLSYHGKEIEKLRSNSLSDRKLMAIRSKLISFGLIWPFAKNRIGMESIKNPLERAVIAPFKAHLESAKPAWWLRAIATKS